MIATLGAHERWARCDDRTAATQALRRGFEARFVRLADPHGALLAAIEAAGGDTTADGRYLLRQLADKTAQHRKAYFTRLALASAQARAARRLPAAC